MGNITEKLEQIMLKENIYKNEPMKNHTSFRIGGMAEYFLKIQSQEELKSVLALAKQENIEFFVIGNGTNLLVRDGGVRGFVMKLDMQKYKIEKGEKCAYITAESGLPLPKLARIAMENELSGMECLAGIPGTLGGAVRMNAGAYGHEMKDIVVCSKCMDKNGKIYEFDLPAHDFSYRKSTFESNGLIILETTFKFQYGEKCKIEQKMQDCMENRMQKQPLELPNAGSIFKRMENVPTAKLIDDCGLKGYLLGGAQISEKHAGFIVNTGNATAGDVLALIEHVQEEVKEKFGVNIELEILIIGEDRSCDEK